jgi:hypothetical protein
MSGWTVRLKNWHAPMYVQCESPPGHIWWTGSRDEAKHFKRHIDAVRFMTGLGERLDQCEITVDRRKPSRQPAGDAP